jgi:transposase
VLNVPHVNYVHGTNKGSRHLTIKPCEEHKALLEAGALQAHDDWKTRYKLQAGIEATMSQGVRANDLRKARYRGLRKTSLQHAAIAAAIKATDWLANIPIATIESLVLLA